MPIDTRATEAYKCKVLVSFKSCSPHALFEYDFESDFIPANANSSHFPTPAHSHDQTESPSTRSGAATTGNGGWWLCWAILAVAVIAKSHYIFQANFYRL